MNPRFGIWARVGGGLEDLMTVSGGKIRLARGDPNVLIVDAAVTHWVKPGIPKINFCGMQLMLDGISSPKLS